MHRSKPPLTCTGFSYLDPRKCFCKNLLHTLAYEFIIVDDKNFQLKCSRVGMEQSAIGTDT